MKKRLIKDNLEDALDHLERLLTGERTTVFNSPFHSLDYPEYHQGTADFLRSTPLRLYLTSWVIPQIKEALEEVSKK